MYLSVSLSVCLPGKQLECKNCEKMRHREESHDLHKSQKDKDSKIRNQVEERKRERRGSGRKMKREEEGIGR